MTIDKSTLIQKYIRLLGNAITVIKTDGSELRDRAILQSSSTRRPVLAEAHAGHAGRYDSHRWDYIGQPSLDITVLTAQDTLLCRGERFFFIQAEAVAVNDTVQYYRGVLRKAEEESDVFSN